MNFFSLTEAPLDPDERALISRGDPEIIRGKLRELNPAEYLVVAKIGKNSNPNSYVEPLIDFGVDIGIRKEQDYGFDVFPNEDETKEVRVFRR